MDNCFSTKIAEASQRKDSLFLANGTETTVYTHAKNNVDFDLHITPLTNVKLESIVDQNVKSKSIKPL